MLQAPAVGLHDGTADRRCACGAPDNATCSVRGVPAICGCGFSHCCSDCVLHWVALAVEAVVTDTGNTQMLDGGQNCYKALCRAEHVSLNLQRGHGSMTADHCNALHCRLAH